MNGDWQCWHASRRGPGHVASGLPNQDAACIRTWTGGFCGAVADGVGSAPRSHIGSHMLCRTACRELKEAAKLGMERVTLPWLENLHNLWGLALQVPHQKLRAYATTCQLLYRNAGTISLARLGDGGSFVILSSGEIESLDSDGECAFANITNAMSSECRGWIIRTYRAEDVRAVYMMTDGIYDDIADRAAFAGELYAAYCSHPAKLIRRDFLAALKNWPVKGHTDDMTIAGFQRKTTP